MAAKLDMKLVNRGDEGELLLFGKLDSQTSIDAEKYFEEASDRFDHLILNMAELSYLSSAGLRILKKTHIKMNRKGGVLSLCNVNDNIMEVFEITGFAGLLNFI
ncbi:MAG: STAS domain-containing protein [Lachnospiraceae bacterium]|jgi:anti-sigma B factor antagonist|nr:STAS domain-containing protein [Lachnospiraceae bacterium]MBR3509398.1 STAS domain-containing protein [Lachnospiraceae bacterium]MBR4607091.1 STAS domain-containing protein [Lachnospiraceae bacterium]MBR6152091.1 STAS domain-containing protein [Lachnospiraceae bacterium]